MRLRWTPGFSAEAARYRLCYQCDDCVFFMADREHCAHEWPTEDHRAAMPAPGDPVTTEIVFCKEFELR